MKESLELILLRVSQSADIDKGELSPALRLIINSVCEGLQITRAASGFTMLNRPSLSVRC